MFWRSCCYRLHAKIASWEPPHLAARLTARRAELESVGFSRRDAADVVVRNVGFVLGQDGKLATNFDHLNAVLSGHIGADSRLALAAAIRKRPTVLTVTPTKLESAIDVVVAAGLAEDRAAAARELLQRPRSIRDRNEFLRRAACGRMFGFDDDAVWAVVQMSSIDRWIARFTFARRCGCAPARALCAIHTVRASCAFVPWGTEAVANRSPDARAAQHVPS